MAKSAEDLIQALYEFFISQGYSPIGASYVIGNLIQESRLDPNALQKDGAGYGVEQLNDPEHAKEVLAELKKQKHPDPKKIKELEDAEKATSKAALQTFADKYGRPVNDFVLQIRFVVNQNTAVTNEFKKAKTEAEAKQAVKDLEHYGIEGDDRYSVAAKIYANVTAKPKARPAGEGLGDKVNPGLNFDTIIKDLKSKFVPKEPGGPVSACPANQAGPNAELNVSAKLV
jgi:hypothetical protein